MKQPIKAEPTTPELETKPFISFDGGVREVAAYHRPDRYRSIEQSLGRQYRTPRGGGYSYAAASFGKNSIVQDLTYFDRILAFEPERGLIKVEAGRTLAGLMRVTIPKTLRLPVIPGYPEIAIGGWRTQLILTAHWILEKTKKKGITEPLFGAMFPFVHR